MKRNYLLAIASMFVITACSTTSGTSPVIGYSGFDKAKTVSIAPHGNACKEMICTALGAEWNQSKPDQALLIVMIANEITGITGASLSIDGEKIVLIPTQQVTDFSSPLPELRQSAKAFIVPLALIERITTAKRVWLRVSTPTGYYEDAVIDGEDSKAYNALKRFMLSVKQNS